MIIKVQGIQYIAHQSSLTKDRFPTYSIALIKKIIINLIYRPLLVVYITLIATFLAIRGVSAL